MLLWQRLAINVHEDGAYLRRHLYSRTTFWQVRVNKHRLAMDSLALPQPKYLVTAAVLLLVFLLSRRRPAGKAPFVRYWVPWIGSALSLGSDPDGFFRRATCVPWFHSGSPQLTYVQ